jgi:hypothetical protein
MLGGVSLVAADDRQRAIADWVRANGALVDRSLWLPASRASTAGATPRAHTGPAPFVVEPAELYDIRPRSAGN